MKYVRSSVSYFKKWLTKSKKTQILEFLEEYSKAVNYFIKTYEPTIPETSKFELLLASHIQPYIKTSGTWLTARAVKNAFSEGYGMVQSAKSNAENRKDKKYFKPTHTGKKAILSQTIATTLLSPSTTSFDLMVILGSLGKKQKIHLPLKKHKHFNKWNELGSLNKSITLHKDRIAFSFEIKSEEKKDISKPSKYLGLDIGIKKLIADSSRNFYGEEFEDLLIKLHRKKRCSKAYYKCKEEIREYINKACKELPWENISLVAVEKLKNLKYKIKVKRRLTKNTRRFISNWNYRQVLDRIQMLSEENRVSFRSVPAYYTSQICPVCGYVDKKNRLDQEHFVCQICSHSDNADIVGATNVLNRFITGAYGLGCEKEKVDKSLYFQ